ncbi:MAG: nucleotidyltransferase domain-containing protein [Planctomycetes bacterium]|nr:nucleotidyltransferase domain-containing protein [Planctomycetota bacterium]
MTTSTTLPPKVQEALDRATGALKKTLGANLHSLVLYGSAVRGNLLEKVSDLNLLILLEQSTPEAHEAISEAIDDPVRIEPFILGRALLARSIQAFAVKFLSIQRNYRVLHGADPFATLKVDESLARFLCEQAVRNLRLRCVRAFVLFGPDRIHYSSFIARMTPAFFTDLAEGLRRVGIDVPRSYEERLPLFEKVFGVDASILLKLLELKASARLLSAAEVKEFHARLFKLLDAALRWMEAQWPPLR